MPLRIELFEPMPKSRAAKKQRIMNLQQQAGMLNPMMMNPLLLQNMMMNPMNQMLMPNAMMNPENQAADSSESAMMDRLHPRLPQQQDPQGMHLLCLQRKGLMWTLPRGLCRCLPIEGLSFTDPPVLLTGLCPGMLLC